MQQIVERADVASVARSDEALEDGASVRGAHER